MSAFAPWALTGESVVGLARRRGVRLGPLPPGVTAVPGPALIVAARYDGSPVGPYLELSVGVPARLGVRLGWCMTTTVVDAADARSGGRANWGFPTELGTLVWERDGGERSLRWVEREIEVRGVPGRTRLPLLVPVRALQRRRDGPVVVPGRLRGLARLATVSVSAPRDDVLAALTGQHRGITVDSMRFLIRPARTPFGLASTLRAPLAAPEPALSSSVPPGAYSSAG
jgi:hypothetical protein